MYILKNFRIDVAIYEDWFEIFLNYSDFLFNTPIPSSFIKFLESNPLKLFIL